MSLTIDGTLRDFNNLFSFSVDMEEGNGETNPKDEVELTDKVELSDEVEALFARGDFLLGKVKQSAEERYELSAITAKLQDIFLEQFKDDNVNRPEKVKKYNPLQDPHILKALYLHRILSDGALAEHLNRIQKVEGIWQIFIQYLWKAGSFAVDAGKFIFKVGKGFSAAFLKFSPSLVNTINFNFGFRNNQLLQIKEEQLERKDQQLAIKDTQLAHKDTQLERKDEQLASHERRMALLEQEVFEERQQTRKERETNRLLEGRVTELQMKCKEMKKTLKQRTKAQKTDRAFKDVYRAPSFISTSESVCRSTSKDRDLFSSHNAPLIRY